MMAKSSDEMAASMAQNLKEKTGKTLQQWIGVVQKCKLVKYGEIVKHLKADHGLTHGYANFVTLKFNESAKGRPVGDEELVAAQYTGDKHALLPIYRAVLKVVERFGRDVEVAPKKTYVSLRRKKQFALIQPSTKSRVDVGINLSGHDATERLEASGSFNAMVSHRVRLARKEQVDADLERWLKDAYEAAG